jgi:hypothetical protein
MSGDAKSQDTIPTSNFTYVDANYSEDFREIVEQLHNYDVDVLPLKELKYVMIVPALPKMWAVLSPDRAGVFMNASIPLYLPTFKKFILFHELGHYLDGEGHPEDGPVMRRTGRGLDIEDIIKNYCEYEEEFLIYLYKKQNEKT